MGVKSTRNISRSTAMYRIETIDSLIASGDYRGLDAEVYEPDYDLKAFVDKGAVHLHVDKWTNKMLEDLMDRPFYRFSMFDNYFVVD